MACSNEQRFRRIPRAPDVTIETPTADQVFRQGEGPLAFSGTADDEFDPPERLDATWILDGGEPVQAEVADDHTVPLTLVAEDLAVGDHHLELVVTDRDGEVGIAAVNWTLLGALEAPVADILSPFDGATFPLGQEITFRGQGTDNNTEPDDLVFAWVSDLDGPLKGAITAGGDSVLFANTLSIGTHLISLNVTDIDGLTGSDQVLVVVGEEAYTPPVQAQVGDIIFSEVIVNPQVVDDELGEWIEVYNTSSYAVDLAGYILEDLGPDGFRDSYTLSGSIIVAPFDFAVLCANTDPALNGGVTCDGWFNRTSFGGPGAYALGNNGDELLLMLPDETIIDQVIYDSSWFVAAKAKGVDPDFLNYKNNDNESNWCNQVSIITAGGEPGTPGQMNDNC